MVNSIPSNFFLKVSIFFSSRITSFLIFFLLIIFSFSYGFSQNNWDQFRGESRNGRVNIPESTMRWIDPVMLWNKEIGSGFSEVVIVDDMIYLMMAEKSDSITGHEVLAAMNSLNGEILWKTPVDTVFIDVDDWGDGPRSTPAVDDDAVFCLSASGKLVAVARSDGKVIWEVDFTKQYGSTIPRWGYSTSPLLFEDLVIMEVGGSDNHGFAAFSKTDGNLRWNAGNANSAYNSPVMIKINGKHQLIFANGSTLNSLSTDGDSLWSYTMPIRSPMALPLFIEPDLLFVSAANDAGSFIVRINDEVPEEVMRSSLMRNDWSSSCYRDGYIYGFNVATLQCIDATTGQRKWLKRGFGKGSLILVNDRLFVLSDLGTLTVVEATPEEYREISTTEVLEGRSWTAPSFSKGRLFLRNHTRLSIYQIMEPADLGG